MIPGFTVLSAIWGRASSTLMIAAALGGAIMIAFGLGYWKGSNNAAHKAAIAALTAERDAVKRDLDIHKADAARAEQLALERAREAEDRARALQEFVDAEIGKPADAKPTDCQPCRDRVNRIDLERLRNLAK